MPFTLSCNWLYLNLLHAGDNKAISQSITETLHGELVDAALDFVNTQDTLERMFYSLNFVSKVTLFYNNFYCIMNIGIWYYNDIAINKKK